MIRKIKPIFFISVALLGMGISSCKKGTFDINDTNPNNPSSADPKYIIASAITNAAVLAAGNPGGGSRSGNDLIECIMGYWAVSGDFSPNAQLLTMTFTTDFGSSFWDNTYPILQNLKNVQTYYGTSIAGNNYVAISKILTSFLVARLVDCYNNIPYSQALQGTTNATPAYDDAQTVYKSSISQLDSAILLLNSATAASNNPGTYDPLYGGTMSKWVTFANTVKLKMLMKFTQISGGTAYITSKMTGLTTASFIGANADATVQPGYATSSNGLLNPMWYDIGFTNIGGGGVNTSYFRANSYSVNFFKNTNDPRLSLFYTKESYKTAAGVQVTDTVVGRAFGSNLGTEHNATISSIGGNATAATQTTGYLKSATQGLVILSSAESYFLQAEAAQRGFLSGTTAATLYQSAVSESFRLLGVASYATVAATYTSQNNTNVNYTTSTNQIQTIMLQKWAAMNTYDPLEAWDDWRRLGIPADLPIPIYPGTTITHMPYRLLYPTTEFSYNTTNANAQGTITQNSKIFWMP